MVNFKSENVIFPLVVSPDVSPTIVFDGETDKEIVYDPEVTSNMQPKLLYISTTIVKASFIVQGYIDNTFDEVNFIHM